MRIGTAFSHQIFLRNLERLGGDLEQALARMSSGKRVLTASDDPRAAEELLRLADESQKYTMRQQGIVRATVFLSETESALSSLNQALIDAHTKGVSGASETTEGESGEPREILADEVAALRETLLSLANRKVDGRYIFAGTRTDAPAFDVTGVYQGNQELIEIPLDGATVAINLPGDEVFGQPGVGGPIALLEQLEAALRANDTAAIQAVLDPLDQAITDNSVLLGRVGARSKQLEDAALRIGDLQLELARRSEELGAADMAQAIIDVQRLEVGYQATLMAGARLFGPTFFDYLG